MKTQVFLASTAFGLVTLTAALADGLFEDGARRVLVVTTHAEMPEASPSLLDVAGAAELAARFDSVVDYNELVDPMHPAGWRPRQEDLPLWQRHLSDRWELGRDVRLIVESIQVDPALALCRIFADAPIDVYADGLMSYGPTRNTLPDSVGTRIERLLHLDLVPGLTPLLLTEWQVPSTVITMATFRALIAQLSPIGARGEDPVVLVLGQYLAAAELSSEEEETALYAEMVAGGGRAYGRRVVFKPHPSAPRSQHAALRAAACAAGVDLEISADAELAESWFAGGRVTAVVGCFSTALLTASTGYGIPVARHGTELMLSRLTPYQNSNRIPVTIVDALLPDLSAVSPGLVGGPSAKPPEAVGTAHLNELIVAVGYAMQPNRYAHRRPEAAEFLARFPASRSRYVKRQRLTRLRLPGSMAPRPVRDRVRRTLRRLNQLRTQDHLTGRGATPLNPRGQSLEGGRPP